MDAGLRIENRESRSAVPVRIFVALDAVRGVAPCSGVLSLEFGGRPGSTYRGRGQLGLRSSTQDTGGTVRRQPSSRTSRTMR